MLNDAMASSETRVGPNPSPSLLGERVWAIVVARTGPRAKSRLATVLEPDQREALALEMLRCVLDVTARATWLSGRVAVVDSSAAAEVARERGVIVLRDAGHGDMNAAIKRGLDWAARAGAGATLVLPGDVPLVEDDDLDRLVRAAHGHPCAVVVGASRAGGGTNALLLKPVDVIAPAFGPPSLERHLALARAAGAAAIRIDGLGLSLDIDTPEDLRALAVRRPGLVPAWPMTA